MGLFNKKSNKKTKEVVPSLPELPKLPELPEIHGLNLGKPSNQEPIHQLPSYPSSSFGEKFSQNAIKEAITGGEEGDTSSGSSQADDLAMPNMEGELTNHEAMQMMQGSPRTPLSREIQGFDNSNNLPKEMPHTITPHHGIVHEDEPIFIRLDKFEDSLKIFEKTRNQLAEMEKMLHQVKDLRNQEERELSFWINEMQIIKNEIDKVDKELFSKVE